MNGQTAHLQGCAPRILVATLVALVVITAPAANAAAEGDSDPSVDQLQVIVVTAEHRSIDAQETPIALTAISGDDMLRSSKVSLDTVLKENRSHQVPQQSAAMAGIPSEFVSCIAMTHMISLLINFWALGPGFLIPDP